MGRAVVLAVASALAVATGGCGHDAVARQGHLTGVVKLCGGAAPGRCFTEPAHIAVVGTDNRVAARSHSLHGRFFFDLVPGIYTVSAKANGYVIRTASVDVVAGKTAHVNITNRHVK
jgi:hypothetical protein